MSIIRIPAKTTPSASVIFLHGLGDSAEGWSFLGREAHSRPNLQHINFVFPTASEKPVPKVFGGYPTTSWYLFDTIGENKACDEKSVLESVGVVKDLIQKETAKGVPASRIIVGGFSQGSAITFTVSILLTFDYNSGC